MNLGQVFMQMARERVAMDRQERAIAEERRQREEEFKNARELQLQDLANDREYAKTEWDRQQAQTTQAYSEREAARLEAQGQAEQVANLGVVQNFFGLSGEEIPTGEHFTMLNQQLNSLAGQLESFKGEIPAERLEEIGRSIYGAEIWAKTGGDPVKLADQEYLGLSAKFDVAVANEMARISGDPRAIPIASQFGQLIDIQERFIKAVPNASSIFSGGSPTELVDPSKRPIVDPRGLAISTGEGGEIVVGGEGSATNPDPAGDPLPVPEEKKAPSAANFRSGDGIEYNPDSLRSGLSVLGNVGLNLGRNVLERTGKAVVSAGESVGETWTNSRHKNAADSYAAILQKESNGEPLSRSDLWHKSRVESDPDFKEKILPLVNRGGSTPLATKSPNTVSSNLSSSNFPFNNV